MGLRCTLGWHDFREPTTPHPTAGDADHGSDEIEVRCRRCGRTKTMHWDPSTRAPNDLRERPDLLDLDRYQGGAGAGGGVFGA
jgi:hypothetical protein